jgi:hypothetical protein
MNIYNIAPKNADPLYTAYTVYHGYEVCVQGKTIEACQKALEKELEAIEVIEMAEDMAA